MRDMRPCLQRRRDRQNLPSVLIFQANFRGTDPQNNVSVTMFTQKDFICRRYKRQT
jgi:hypothetical protein